MNTFHKMIFAATFISGSLTLNSCTEEVTIGKFDESQYGNTEQISAFPKDGTSGKSENIVELRTNAYTTSMYVGLNKAPQKGVDIKISYDADYQKTYNAAHGTDYQLFPEELISIGRDGNIVVAPDEIKSLPIDLTIKPATATLEEGKTYILPLKASTMTEGISLSEATQHSVYLIKNFHNESDCDKGADAVKNFLYFEVNDTNPLNALEFACENGKLFFDCVVLFAANINYNAETGRVYVYNNPNVQFLLDNNETYLQPLRKRGIKVLLGILGNHDSAGVCQLSNMGAEAFAGELAAICKGYNLDGVNFDDEYSNSPDLSNPWFASHSSQAGARLLYETKRAMPDKLVTVYYLGSLGSYCPSVDGTEPAEFVDIVVNDYGASASPMRGMTLKQCSGMSVELRRGGGMYNANESYAREVKRKGYGHFMWFALDPSLYNSQLSYLQNVSRGLYDMELKYPAFYYKKNDSTRYPIK